MKNNSSCSQPVSLGRHAAECKICAHDQRDEIERDFINWRSPASIAKQYKIKNRASVYRHAHALGLFPKRQRNVRAALEKIIERAGEVEVNATAVVSSSRAAWDREQEIIHHAGGGELLFAEILNRHADKIIIRDPRFQIPPFWKRLGGFDHGKTNPTAALVVAIDTDGTIYCLAEYYQPDLTPRQHMENLELLPGFLDARPIYADPSIFYRTQAQSDGGFKSIEDLYREAGLRGLSEGQNAEIAGMERILEHWRDLDHREPTLKIVCREDYSRRRFGLFPDGCPNLLWELMRTRREQLSASQLMRKNPTEAIVDKDNHLRDALKYILLSLPSPSERPREMKRDEIIQQAFATGTYPTLGVQMARLDVEEARESEPISYRARLPREE